MRSAKPLRFDTPNGLITPAVSGTLRNQFSAVQDQLQLRRTFGPHALAIGAYVANYTEDNHWFFSNILTDVRDIPRLTRCRGNSSRRNSHSPYSQRLSKTI
jgi:hypothetical protein